MIQKSTEVLLRRFLSFFRLLVPDNIDQLPCDCFNAFHIRGNKRLLPADIEQAEGFASVFQGDTDGRANPKLLIIAGISFFRASFSVHSRPI